MSYQPGGVDGVLSHSMTPRVISAGNDKRGLGRWTWTQLQGKNKVVTIMSVYRPFQSSSLGVQIVYEQHARTLPIQYEPRSQLLKDLKEYL